MKKNKKKNSEGTGGSFIDPRLIDQIIQAEVQTRLSKIVRRVRKKSEKAIAKLNRFPQITHTKEETIDVEATPVEEEGEESGE